MADPLIDAVGAALTVTVAVWPVIVCEQPATEVALVTEYIVVDEGITLTVLVPPLPIVVVTVDAPFQ